MRIVLQRVSEASVVINGGERRGIEQGLVLLVGFCPEDTLREVDALAKKAVNLRIFSDDSGAMNLSLLDIAGHILVVSNFTLYANCQKGRRPSFTDAAPPELAADLYSAFVERLEQSGRAAGNG